MLFRSAVAEEKSLTLQDKDLVAYLTFQNAQKTKTSRTKQKESAQVLKLAQDKCAAAATPCQHWII